MKRSPVLRELLSVVTADPVLALLIAAPRDLAALQEQFPIGSILIGQQPKEEC